MACEPAAAASNGWQRTVETRCVGSVAQRTSSGHAITKAWNKPARAGFDSRQIHFEVIVAKILNLEKALERVPADARDEMRETIEKLFEDFDPNNPPGQAVRPLSVADNDCPECGVKLRLCSTVEWEGKLVSFLECPKCDACFEREALH